MRRFLLPILTLVLTVALTACAGGGKNVQPKEGAEFGELKVTMQDITQTEKQWSGNIVIANPTEKNQVVEYYGPAKYILAVTQGETEILTMPFEPRDPNKQEIVNLGKGVERKHFVVWTFVDQKGNKVPAGKYEVRVTLNAASAKVEGKKVVGPTSQGKVFGPFTVTVK